jgi:hypothetical protein
LVGLKEAGFTGFRIKANGRGGLSFEDSKKSLRASAASSGMLSSCPNQWLKSSMRFRF